jgi:hypothetical protein
MTPDNQDETLGFLVQHRLAYVGVDMPQGHCDSIPPLLAATAPDLAVVRMLPRVAARLLLRGREPADPVDPRHARPRAPSTPTARAAAGLTHPADGHERCLGPVSGMHRTRAGHVWLRCPMRPVVHTGRIVAYRLAASSRYSASASALAALSAWPVVLVVRATGDHSRSCCAAGSRRYPYGGQPGTRLPEVQLLTRRHSRQPSPRRPSDRCPAVALFPPLVTASNTATLPPAAGRCTAHGEDQARPAPPALAEGPARWHATPAPAQR